MTVTAEHILAATWKKKKKNVDLQDTKTLGFVLESYSGIFLIINVPDDSTILIRHYICYKVYTLWKMYFLSYFKSAFQQKDGIQVTLSGDWMYLFWYSVQK